MNDYRNVRIVWNDNLTEEFAATVCIGEWDGKEPDEHIFFYFGSEEEFEWHKTHHDLEDFRIVSEEK
jgi:hypothetical protein